MLVVDDEPAIREMVKMALSTRGLEVLEAPDGLRGLVAAETHRPDVIVCDVMMPGTDGFEVVRRIRAHATLQGTPVIMLTAQASVDDQWRGWTVGADSYMTKPLDPELLVNEIRRVTSD